MNLKRKLNYRNSANSLTILRLFLGLPLILLLSQNKIFLAWCLLIIGALTDWLDGFLARKAGGGSSWGSKIDPLADKIMSLAPLLWISQLKIFPIWAIWLLISREMLITAWRSNGAKDTSASIDAKLKTTLQFLSFLLILWPKEIAKDNLLITLNQLGYILLWAAIVMSIFSALRYINSQ